MVILVFTFLLRICIYMVMSKNGGNGQLPPLEREGKMARLMQKICSQLRTTENMSGNLPCFGIL
jgi:hypothetical protein